MDPKKMIGRLGKYVLHKEAAAKILPMEGAKPVLGWKAKVAGALAVVAAIAGTLSQFIGGQ